MLIQLESLLHCEEGIGLTSSACRRFTHIPDLERIPLENVIPLSKLIAALYNDIAIAIPPLD